MKPRDDEPFLSCEIVAVASFWSTSSLPHITSHIRASVVRFSTCSMVPHHHVFLTCYIWKNALGIGHGLFVSVAIKYPWPTSRIRGRRPVSLVDVLYPLPTSRFRGWRPVIVISVAGPMAFSFICSVWQRPFMIHMYIMTTYSSLNLCTINNIHNNFH